MLAPSPSQHLESEIRPHGNPPYDSDIPNPALIGATVAFASTKEEREARGDTRPSIAERYASRDVYLEQVRQAAQQLVGDGYLLAEDLELVVDLAAKRFDFFARPSAGTTP